MCYKNLYLRHYEDYYNTVLDVVDFVDARKCESTAGYENLLDWLLELEESASFSMSSVQFKDRRAQALIPLDLLGESLFRRTYDE